MDQEDLYVYETNPKDPDSYRYNGKWEKMTVEKQTIDVRGEGAAGGLKDCLARCGGVAGPAFGGFCGILRGLRGGHGDFL